MKYINYLLVLLTLLISCKEETKTEKPKKIKTEKIVKDFDLVFNDFTVKIDTLKSGATFSTILEEFQLPDSLTSNQITDKIKDTFNLKNIRAGKEFYSFCDKKIKNKLKALVYVEDKSHYLFVDLRDSIRVYRKEKPTILKRRTVAAALDGSLSETLNQLGVSTSLAPQMAQIYAYTIDFFKIKKGDKFAITIQEKYFENGEYLGVEKIEACYFEYKGKKIYAFPYKLNEKQKRTEYYDDEGKGMKTMFLKAPLDFFRLTSRFSSSRFHPVQLRWKAHNGTDYAAPHGTPIKTTASGIVERTGYTAGNGNFVKVRHNNMYSTQYLHMSKILVRNGQHVSQGQTIGKVGSTGLATGPHVCYRFWKNGIQVDPLRLKLPNTEPMAKKEKNKYLAYIKPLKKELDNTTTKTFKEE